MTTYELADAVVASTDDPDAFRYSPRTVDIAVDANGRAQLNLLGAGPVAFLQVTGTWGLNAERLERVRRELAERLGRDASALRLQPMGDSVENVTLLLRDGDDLVVLGQSKSSGAPPYHAAFNVMLDAKRLDRVKEALGGKEHQLLLRYDIARTRPLTTARAERTASASAATCQSPDVSSSAWSATTTDNTATETRDEITRFSVELDAAHWAAAHQAWPHHLPMQP